MNISTEALSSTLIQKGFYHISGIGTGLKHLRFYHVKQEKEDIYLFSNEAICDNADVVLTLPQSGACLIYEPWDNKCYRGMAKEGKLPLKLEKGNMVFVIFGSDVPKGLPVFRCEVDRKTLPLRFDIAVRTEEETDFHTIATNTELYDISEKDSRFSGEVLYRTKFIADPSYTVLDLGEVGEVAEAWLNGQYLGARINAPYKFSLRDTLREGENDLKILVKSNLAHRRRDMFSKYLPIPPTGIVGDVAICQYEDLYTL